MMNEPAYESPSPSLSATPTTARAPMIDASVLSRAESQVWSYLATRCGSTVPTETLAREALGRSDDKASILVRHCIFRLRALLGSERMLLQHVRGHGYRLLATNERASLPNA